MKKIVSLFLTLVFMLSIGFIFTGCNNDKEVLLHKKYKDYFPIGVAFNNVLFDHYSELIPHYNSFTAEYEMKWKSLQPTKGNYTFATANKIVEFAKSKNMLIRGHALVWYQEAPDWLFKDDLGEAITKEELFSRMEHHITTVMNHFGDDIYCWDVVNEAITDDNTSNIIYRQCDWYRTAGKDYIAEAFRIARAVNPNIKLFYNDYHLDKEPKRNRTLALLKELIDDGVPIDGIGMQGHYNLLDFKIEEFEKSLKAFIDLGLEVQITELDISIYPWGPETQRFTTFPAVLEQAQADMYGQIFEVLRRHKDNVTGVTFWGAADDYTWLDNEPIRNRKNWPLVFDEFHQPKKAFHSIINF